MRGKRNNLQTAAAFLIGGCVLAAATRADNPADDVSRAEARLKADVSYLASDELAGRGTGTSGNEQAAEHIARVFRESGLKTAPGANGYFQPFPVRGDLRLKDASLTLQLGDEKVKGERGRNFSPLAIGSKGEVEGGSIVFAGFGITADEEKLKYDDYADIDASGKVVLIIRREPDPADKSSPFAGSDNTTYATFQHKVVNAMKHGAKAVLVVNDRSSIGDTSLLDYGATPRGGDIPFVMISRDLADKILAAASQPKLAELEDKIDATLKPQSRALEGPKIDLSVDVTRDPIQAKNVIGVLEGQGPLADETIIVGAHYDHLGRGGIGSLAFGSNEIHNGADDNASGTATVLELARRLAARPDPLPRRVVFMLFSGEELGLLGSAYYANEQPLYPLEKTVAMLNFDMVGRYEADKGLTVYGAGSSEGFAGLVETLARTLDFKTKLPKPINDGFSDSDHSSFFRKNIPILFFFTGTHPDYHKPSDDSDKINYEGMSRVADLGELILLDLAKRPRRPEFTAQAPEKPKVANADPHAGSTTTSIGGGAYFGSRPAYGEDVEGVKLDGVTEGSPADKAGLKAGDVIIKFAGLPVKDIQGYTLAMGSKKPGDKVEVVVIRDGKELTLSATLGQRRQDKPKD